MFNEDKYYTGDSDDAASRFRAKMEEGVDMFAGNDGEPFIIKKVEKDGADWICFALACLKNLNPDAYREFLARVTYWAVAGYAPTLESERAAYKFGVMEFIKMIPLVTPTIKMAAVKWMAFPLAILQVYDPEAHRAAIGLHNRADKLLAAGEPAGEEFERAFSYELDRVLEHVITAPLFVHTYRVQYEQKRESLSDE